MGTSVGKRIKRNEDPDLLTGRALFVDDVQIPGMLHVAYLRADFAHARILSIDVSAAREREGVVAVYTAEDLGDYWQPGPLLVSPPPIERLEFHARTQVPLAKDKIRQAGEPIVAVVAESRYIAEDALADIEVDVDVLDAVVDIEAALVEGAPLVHEDLASNLAAQVIQEKGDYAAIRDQADILIERRFVYDRGTAAAMENRGVVANWDEKSRRMTIWDTTQAPIPVRNGLAAMLGLSENQVQVIAPYIGGGFGPKIMMFYPEEVLIPWVSMQLGRPIKWIEDRTENFFATTQERAQVHYAELAMTKAGKILGVRDRFIHDTGAYDPYGLTVPINAQCTLIGPYLLPNYYSEFKVVFTNKPIVTPYRGAGRQHGVFVMERLLDLGAKALGISPVEIRKRNYIAPDDFPHHHEIIYQDFAELVYDSGNYLPALERTVELIDYDRFKREEQPKLKKEGRCVGIGVVSYVEGTGIGPYEGARVRVEVNGEVSVATGVGTQGQGHFTSFAQIVADALGTAPDRVRVVTGDTREFHWGTGTFACRGLVVAGNACHAAATQVRAKALKLASELLEAAETDLRIEDGRVFVVGAREMGIDLGDLAKQANPLRGAVKPGTEPGLESTAYFGPERGATGSGVQAMIVEVDPSTMLVEIQKLVMVHDCGVIVNPMIVEGQIQGAVAQGIGNAFYEQLHFDESGQLMNASFVDYLLPTATDVPDVIMDHIETRSPGSPLGVKGVGEGGAIPVGPAFCQAVEDALAGRWELDIKEIPLSPNRLYELIQAATEQEGPAT